MKIIFHNEDIRKKAKERNVRLWEIADKMKISEPTMTRMLRKELSDEKKTEIFSIIDELSKEKAVL